MEEKKEKFNIMNYLFPYIIVVLRSTVIAIKYGYYSKVHLELLTELKLGVELNTFDLVNAVIYESNPIIISK